VGFDPHGGDDGRVGRDVGNQAIDLALIPPCQDPEITDDKSNFEEEGRGAREAEIYSYFQKKKDMEIKCSISFPPFHPLPLFYNTRGRAKLNTVCLIHSLTQNIVTAS
jgi:hypothetical protein